MKSIEDFVDNIYNGDCLDILARFQDNSIDLIVTDPPYGVEFEGNKFYNDSKEYVFSLIDKWTSELYRVLKEGSHAYFFVPTLEIDKWICSIKKNFKLNNVICTNCYTTNLYIKNNFTFDSQLILFCSKGKAKAFNKVDWLKTSKVWFSDKRNPNKKFFTYQYTSFIPKEFRANVKANDKVKLLHPNQKNDKLIEKFILLSSNVEEIVLDPFCGSATTLVASIKLNRKYIGIDIEKKYYEIAKKRLNNPNLLELAIYNKAEGKRLF